MCVCVWVCVFFTDKGYPFCDRSKRNRMESGRADDGPFAATVPSARAQAFSSLKLAWFLLKWFKGQPAGIQPFGTFRFLILRETRRTGLSSFVLGGGKFFLLHPRLRLSFACSQLSVRNSATYAVGHQYHEFTWPQPLRISAPETSEAVASYAKAPTYLESHKSSSHTPIPDFCHVTPR